MGPGFILAPGIYFDRIITFADFFTYRDLSFGSAVNASVAVVLDVQSGNLVCCVLYSVYMLLSKFLAP
jgi:hypothetical protein